MESESEDLLTTVFLPICGGADGDTYPQGQESIMEYLQEKLVPYFKRCKFNERKIMISTLENALRDPSMSWERLAASHLFPFEFPLDPEPLIEWLIEELKNCDAGQI